MLVMDELFDLLIVNYFYVWNMLFLFFFNGYAAEWFLLHVLQGTEFLCHFNDHAHFAIFD